MIRKRLIHYRCGLPAVAWGKELLELTWDRYIYHEKLERAPAVRGIQKLAPSDKMMHLKRINRWVRDIVTQPGPPVARSKVLLRSINTAKINVLQSVDPPPVGV